MELDSDVGMESSPRRPLTSIVLLFIVGVFIFSIYYLYDAVIAFVGSSTNAVYQLMIGLLGFTASFYMMTQFMRRLTMAPQPPPNIVTAIECRKCGFKNVRTFAKGDYVLKTVENCQKCNEPMLITGIYVEEVRKK